MAMEVIYQNWLQMEIPTKRSVCCANKNYNYIGKYKVISQVKSHDEKYTLMRISYID